MRQEEGRNPHSITTHRGVHGKEAVSPNPSMSNPQEEARVRAEFEALEERRRGYMRERDQLIADIQARE